MTLVRTKFKRQPAKEPKPKPGPRQRKCKCCGASFVPFGIQSWCGPECGYKLSQVAVTKKKAKEQRQERAETKAKLMRKSDHAELAQKAVNRYVNLRDREKCCVSCGKSALDGGVRNASHFKSVGSNSALRFNLWNIHTSCYRCNVELSGNLGEYYPRLVERIGLDKVDFLRNSPRNRRYEVGYLIRIKKIFTRKAKRTMKRVE